MKEHKIKQTTEKILRIKNENEVLKNLERFGEFLAEKGIIAGEIITDVIYTNEPEKADDRFLQFTVGYMTGTSTRLDKVLTDFGVER